VLLTCGAAAEGSLGSHWRAGSVRAGPLWFIGGRQLGYVRYGRPQGAGRAIQGHGRLHLIVMIVEVKFGSTVVLKPTPEARAYFQFVDGFRPGGGNELPTGDTGFTLVSCPRGYAGPSGQVTDFYLGFSIQAGRSAPVQVWPSALSGPTWVTFSCPASSCEGERQGSNEARAAIDAAPASWTIGRRERTAWLRTGRLSDGLD
jgi:hypothetical protein